ncbi:heme oxygenase-like protein, partial [Trichocladium antarcticum]
WSLTAHLLAAQQPLHRAATQHAFLRAAAAGRLPRPVLARWLAADRLYMHLYLRAAGQLLAALHLPLPLSPGPEWEHDPPAESRLADWLVDALVAVRREERLLGDVAARYGLMARVFASTGTALDRSRESVAAAAAAAAAAGLCGADSGASSPAAPPPPPPPPPLPWLEGALTFWGTERCYLDAWSFARDRARECGGGSGAGDADGGALRNELIPNWSSPEFREFVDRLARLIDGAVREVLERAGDEDRERVKGELLARVEGPWKTLLEAEREFWPDV